MRKILVLTLAALMMITCLTGCETAESAGLEACGIQIDLPEGLKNASGQVGYQSYDFAYVGSDMAIFGSKGDLNAEGVAEGMTLMTVAENAVKSLETPVEIQTAEKGYLYIVFDADTGMNEFTNVTAFFENSGELWMIQISSKVKKYDEAAVFAMLDSVIFVQ